MCITIDYLIEIIMALHHCRIDYSPNCALLRVQWVVYDIETTYQSARFGTCATWRSDLSGPSEDGELGGGKGRGHTGDRNARLSRDLW